MSRSKMFLLLPVICLMFLGLAVVGCSSKMKGKTTLAVYQEAIGEGVREGIEALRKDFKRERPLGYEEPVVPVMVPPETMLIWFTPQLVGKDIFIHGHWEQVVITPWEWNPELIQNRGGDGSSPSWVVPLPLHPESKTKAGE